MEYLTELTTTYKYVYKYIQSHNYNFSVTDCINAKHQQVTFILLQKEFCTDCGKEL